VRPIILLCVLSLIVGGWGEVVRTAAQQRSPDHVLDVLTYEFTPAKETQESGIVMGGSMGMSSGDRREPLSARLAVTLISLDRTSFQWGDSVIYEVLLENVGRVPIVLPWSPDPNLFLEFAEPSSPPPYQKAVVELQVLTSTSKLVARLPAQGLYGSDAVAGSLLVMAPRQTALIRIPTQWSVSDAEHGEVMREQPNGEVRVTASFLSISERPGSVRAKNELDVLIAPR
jgi:hypothetical protein